MLLIHILSFLETSSEVNTIKLVVNWHSD